MRECKKRKRFGFRILGLLAVMLAFCLPVSAGVQEGAGEYEIYPNPQSVAYGTGTVALTDQVNVTMGEDIDSYTETRINDTLKVLNLTKSQTAGAANTNLIVGVYESGDAADTYGASHGVDAEIYEEYDAYTLWIKGKDIVVLGQDADAAYYGVTTLKRIFEQLKSKSVRELTVKDYAEVQFRGFIEGYYGNPWSIEDRVELMKFGGEIKMNQYVFAPKDDPYHNSRWRELYPEEKLEGIRTLAKAGNESKCFFVYALHTFMNNAIRFDTEANYKADMDIIKAKFTQVIEAGVRQVAILEDDAAGASAPNIIRMLNELTEWLHEMKKTYPDLKTDILYCPTDYMYTTSQKLTAINAGVNREVHIVMTGGKIWGEVTSQFADAFYAGLETDTAEGRYPYMWVNWPCSDNYKTGLIMGGHNTILQTGIDGHKYEGVILNPMQQSEASKVPIFTAADYCWNPWTTAAEGDQAWEDSFKYVDHVTPIETDKSEALREVSRHMIYQGPVQTVGRQKKFDESIVLEPKLRAFRDKLDAGTLGTADITAMKAEFRTLVDASELYLKEGTNRRLATQIVPFLSCLRDLTKANLEILDALEAELSGDESAIWENFAEAQTLYEQSQGYGFDYVGVTRYATAGLQHIVPHTDRLMKYLSDTVKFIVDPEHIRLETNFIFQVGGNSTPADNMQNATDGNLDTTVLIQRNQQVGDYLGMTFNIPTTVKDIRMALTTSGHADDYFFAGTMEYTMDGKTWTAFATQPQGGAEFTMTLPEPMDIRGFRWKCTGLGGKDRWLGIKDVGYNITEDSEESEGDKMDYTNTEDTDWRVEYAEESAKVFPRANVTLKKGEYIGLKLDRIHAITGITMTGTGMDNLTLERSLNQTEWKTGTNAGAARYIRLMNKTNSDVTFSLTALSAAFDEIKPMDLLETTIGGQNSDEDARKSGTTRYWMDGDLTTKAKYCAPATKNGYVTYDLGQEIDINSVKVYVLDTAFDYPRDAVLQASMDKQNWTDILTIGDGKPDTAELASTKPTENGWLHDTVDPAYAYLENRDVKVKAKYLRLFFTEGYANRWVELNEILLNDGAYISMINDPTFESDAALQRGYDLQKLNDGDLTTTFRPDMTGKTKGYFIYHLSESTKIKKLNIVQSGNAISHATVSVRTGEDTWKEIGTLDKSLNTLYTYMYDDVYSVKVEWKDVAPVFYEVVALQVPGSTGDDLKQEQLKKAEAERARIENELKTAADAVQAAENSWKAAQSSVSAAQAKVNAAKDQAAKLAAELELAKAKAEENRRAADLADKIAEAAPVQARAALLDADILRIQGKDAEAQAKVQAAADLRQQAEDQKKIADEKRKAQAALDSAVQAKQDELNAYKPPVNSNPPTPNPPGENEKPPITVDNYKNVKYKVLSASAKTAAAVGVTTKRVKSVTVYSTVKIGNTTYKVVQISAKAFKGCTKLTKATIGSNVKKIGREAFASCTKLKTVNMKKAAKVTSIEKKAFTKIYAKAKITVPAKKLSKYKKMLKKAGVSPKVIIKK